MEQDLDEERAERGILQQQHAELVAVLRKLLERRRDVVVLLRQIIIMLEEPSEGENTPPE
jgi:hypothetical protein